MTKNDLIMFFFGIVIFILGINYLVFQRTGRTPIGIKKLQATFAAKENSELIQSLEKVTSKSKGETAELAKSMFLMKKQHIDFLLNQSESKVKTKEYIESEIATFDYQKLSDDSLSYLEKLFFTYFKVQRDVNLALKQYQFAALGLRSQSGGNEEGLKKIQIHLLNAFPEQKIQLVQKLNSK